MQRVLNKSYVCFFRGIKTSHIISNDIKRNCCFFDFNKIKNDDKYEAFGINKKYITRYWAEHTNKKIHESKINEWREQFPILADYDDKDLMIWRNSFNNMDKDKDNFISHADLQKSDWSLEKYTLFQNYDMDKNNLIDFGEYIQAIIDIDTQHFKNFFQGFSKIDIELEFEKYAITEKENNKKVIPLSKLMQMITDKEFTCVTETDSLKLFKSMDMNKDGSIDFEDFLQWVGKK
ncbi:hypothetical protein PFAG_02054 [Plasmodium falciparum Santa Lucia]|uniref:EF-hand calcium-binding domain-containing protein, putative n=12 Tax=Plasmodium falciparum TaxID=5833 RepID=C0H4U9_PLAF7|nr:EF-hand calcium-binding domain-containing protein, putative [Plasmodium falciparum 3D7]ETW19081.1 hypothetical protein PFFVO_02100 [Plasmodium falciparum Vietnam Oak-Knoll (FVO)]ETW37164.1 hypothetical protein PFTANZ_02172 [Plasmodium falciparum Tanzania (2000708)]ETW43308.1 hypothetical protein PFNF135_02221 [Plasmodium falciparum NF135/5.C10]ETW49928.1 hypothetical protein PFMALIP_02117 [Plasmodium falciparum MaliPS096_E11]ETW52497.1 hypothetical protein PFUGPA_05504 [Plasmodium falciparu|eukprot:XP_002808849.1 conserved Plasmodium protein, unknown function [Plasmodium falciparum 3D7]